jgi:hypothetical protein
MKVLSAKVVDGKLDVPEDVLEEGITVTILVPEAEGDWELTPEQEAFLRQSLEEADRGDVVDGWQLLNEIRSA